MKDFILPISWYINDKQSVPLRVVEKKLYKNYRWIVYGSLSYESKELFYDYIFNSSNFVLRGVRRSLLEELYSYFGGEFIVSGTEGIINISDFVPKKSVVELAKRGNKNSFIAEISNNICFYLEYINELIEEKRVEWKVQLENLFIQHYEYPLRTFVLFKSSRILGLVTISPFCGGGWHIEQMIRSKNAHNGTMEALILYVINTLKAEGNKILSLGEVPFSSETSVSLKNKIYNFTGKRIRFAYDSVGLYNFKNKFNPVWYPVYLYGYPSLSYNVMYSLMRATKVDKLILKKVMC